MDKPALKKGTVREIFNLSGKIPVSKERFITWASGVENKSGTLFKTLVLRSSISRLVLVSKDKIISLTVEWSQFKSSKLELEGWTNKSGLVEAAGIFERMSLAISEKKVLNKLAISVGSEIHVLLMNTYFKSLDFDEDLLRDSLKLSI